MTGLPPHGPFALLLAIDDTPPTPVRVTRCVCVHVCVQVCMCVRVPSTRRKERVWAHQGRCLTAQGPFLPAIASIDFISLFSLQV